MDIYEPPQWLGDDPIGQTVSKVTDKYDRQAFADAAAGVLNRVSGQTASAVMGLVGPWGSGKTSMFNLIQDSLQESAPNAPQWITTSFNPWAHGDQLSLQAGFFAHLRSALPKGDSWTDVDATLGAFATRIAPLGSIVSLAGFDASQIVSSIGKQLMDSSTGKTEERAKVALASSGKRLLMIIDDLDRLSSSELLEVFKLVRLVGRLPNVYYLLSYDEETLVELLRKTDLVGDDDRRRSTEYLEKIVQIRLDMPTLREYHLKSFVDEALVVFKSYTPPIDDETIIRFMSLFDGVLSTRLITIRSLRRYFAQVDAFWPAVSTHVDFSDFAAVTWLRTFEPSVYAWVSRNKLELLGLSSYSYRVVQPEPGEEKVGRWKQELRKCHIRPEDANNLFWLVQELFPYVRRMAASASASPSAFDSPAKRLSNADYFDRYFRFGVPAEDVADTVVSLGAIAIATNKPGASRDALEDAFKREPELVLRKMRQMSVRLPGSGRQMFNWLAMKHSITPRHGGQWALRDRIEDVAIDLCLQVDAEGFLSSLQDRESTSDRLLFAAAHHRVSQFGEATRHPVASREKWVHTVRNAVLDAVRASCSTATSVPVFDVSRDVWDHLYYWKFYDEVGVVDFVESAIATGTWTRMDLLAVSLSALLPHGVPDEVGVLSGNDGTLEPWINVQKTIEEVGSLRSAAVPVGSLYRAPATKENRLRLAQSILDQHRSVD